MDLRSIPMFNMLNHGLGWLTRNHELLSENIANANTPGFEAKKLTKTDFDPILRAASRPVRMAHTNGHHLTGTRSAGRFKESVVRDTYEVSMTGNSVSLEEQSVEIARNAMQYQLVTTLYGKNLKLIKIALGNRN
jgi:flagellar basal-body rod protein FlgB